MAVTVRVDKRVVTIYIVWLEADDKQAEAIGTIRRSRNLEGRNRYFFEVEGSRNGTLAAVVIVVEKNHGGYVTHPRHLLVFDGCRRLRYDLLVRLIVILLCSSSGHRNDDCPLPEPYIRFLIGR
ncbi:hypothetical protein L2E82_28624 [Cichorium intybus]|uniref:Uncharacterized protein n=1 Tax=Cichorium intybus TaxID=13427 RepID=A0ACB9CWA8_CICIN|nr:hypothetical protein L2E82_28624 [Cichorium intybus]